MTAFFADKKSLLLSLLLVAAGIGAYANSFDGPFIFDDEGSIPGNVYIRQLWPPRYLVSAPGLCTVSGRPIVSLTLALNYALSGYKVWSYHLFNLLIHISAGLVLYGIVRRTLLTDRLKNRFGEHSSILAWAIATIWLVHPLQTESVTYIVQRTESLMGLFYLLTLYTALRAMQSQRPAAWSVLSVVCCGFGMATKEVMVTAPVVILFYDRTFGAGSFGLALRRRGALYAGLASTWCILALLILSAYRAAFDLGPLEYLFSQFGVILHYLRLSFWPKHLCLDYSWPVEKDYLAILLSVFVVFLPVAATVWGFIRNRSWSYLGVWFFVILAPTSSFVPIADLVFEHRMYLPLAGLVVLVVLGGYSLLARLSSRFGSVNILRTVGIPSVLVVSVLLGWGSFVRNRDYQSVAGMWQKVITVVPNNRRAHYNLGNAFRAAGMLDEAIGYYRRALEIEPRYTDALSNLGLSLKAQGKVDEAIGCYQRAIELDSEHAEAHNNLGVALESTGQRRAAINHYEKAVRIRPDYIDARYNLGNALAVSGRFAEAASQLRELLRYGKNQARVHIALGLVLKVQGDLDQAISHYRRAIEIDADSADAHNNLGTALAGAGKLDEAIYHFRQVLRINPSDAEANYNLALALKLQGDFDNALGYFREAVKQRPGYLAALNEATQILLAHPDTDRRDASEAIKLAERAAESTGYGNPAVLAVLADCYAAAGRLEEALETSQMALRIATAAGNKELASRIAKQIRGYQQQPAAP